MAKRVFQSRVFAPRVFLPAALAGVVVSVVTGCIAAQQVYTPGRVQDTYQGGMQKQDTYQGGAVEQQGGCCEINSL